MQRVSILDQLATDMQEHRQHKLDPTEMTPLHRLHCALVTFMRTVPPWTRQDYVALVEHADEAAANGAPAGRAGVTHTAPSASRRTVHSCDAHSREPNTAPQHGKVTMPSDGRLVGWIEPREDGYLAAFVAKREAKRRAPATRLFRSPDEARQWVVTEAQAVGAPVEWLASAGPA